MLAGSASAAWPDFALDPAVRSLQSPLRRCSDERVRRRSLRLGHVSHFSKQNPARTSMRPSSPFCSAWRSTPFSTSCEPFRKQFVPRHTLTLVLSSALRLHQRKRLIRNPAAALVAGVQQMMRLFSADLAQELRVALGDEDVVLRLMQLQHLVRVIQALGPERARIASRWSPAVPRRRCIRRGRPSLRSGRSGSCRPCTCSATTRAFRNPCTMASLSSVPLTVIVASRKPGIAAHLLEFDTAPASCPVTFSAA